MRVETGQITGDWIRSIRTGADLCDMVAHKTALATSAHYSGNDKAAKRHLLQALRELSKVNSWLDSNSNDLHGLIYRLEESIK